MKDLSALFRTKRGFQLGTGWPLADCHVINNPPRNLTTTTVVTTELPGPAESMWDRPGHIDLSTTVLVDICVWYVATAPAQDDCEVIICGGPNIDFSVLVVCSCWTCT